MNNKKRWMLSLGAVAAAAVLLAVPAVNGQKATAKAKAKQPVVVMDLDQAELSGLEAELARVQEQIAAKLAGIEQKLSQRLEQKHLAELSKMELSQALISKKAEAELEMAQAQHAMEAGKTEMEHALALAEEAVQEPQVWVSGESDSGWLGVSIAEVTAEKAIELKLPSERGALINDVDSDSPASKAGLKANDVITEFAAQRVEGTVQLRRFIRETPPGRTVQLTVWRDGRAQQISVTLVDVTIRIRDRIRERIVIPSTPKFDYRFEMPQLDIFRMTTRPTLGIQTQDLDGQLGSYFGAPEGEGVLVQHVNTGSPAEKAGMQAGDVIVKVEGVRIRSASELREKLRDHREKKTVAVAVLRKGAETTLNVEIEQPKPPEKLRTGRRVAI